MPTTLTLSDLITPATRDSVVNTILAYLSANNFPVTDWEVGGVERTRLAAWVTAMVDYITFLVPAVSSGGYVDYATGDWLTLLAAQRYNLTRNDATSTVGNVTLTASAAAGPYTITAGQLIIQFNTGNRYTNITGGTLNSGGTLTLSFQSEHPNDSTNGLNYVDASGQTPTLITSLPGVTVTNPASTFSSVSQVGTGTGTLALSGSPSPTVGHQYEIQILTSGQAGAATWQSIYDGGAAVNQGSAASATIGSATVTLTNGALNPSFIQGDVYIFNTPGSWITSQGTDQETDAALAQRCRDRWTSLSEVPTSNLYDLWARAASSLVTQTAIVTDAYVNNKVNIIVAGQAGALDAGTIATVQAYINPRAPLTDFPVVQSPVSVAITITATVTISSVKETSAKAGIDTAVATYMDDVGINGTVRVAEIIRAVCDQSGVIDCTGVSLSSSPSITPDANGNIVLGQTNSFQLVSYTQVPSASFSFVLV